MKYESGIDRQFFSIPGRLVPALLHDERDVVGVWVQGVCGVVGNARSPGLLAHHHRIAGRIA